MSQTIKVVSNIDAGDVGTLVVGWELECNYEVPTNIHPDNETNIREEYRSVAHIGYCELHIFDKLGIMITHSYTRNKRIREILEKQLLESVENKSIEEIKNDN